MNLNVFLYLFGTLLLPPSQASDQSTATNPNYDISEDTITPSESDSDDSEPQLRLHHRIYKYTDLLADYKHCLAERDQAHRQLNQSIAEKIRIVGNSSSSFEDINAATKVLKEAERRWDQKRALCVAYRDLIGCFREWATQMKGGFGTGLEEVALANIKVNLALRRLEALLETPPEPPPLQERPQLLPWEESQDSNSMISSNSGGSQSQRDQSSQTCKKVTIELAKFAIYYSLGVVTFPQVLKLAQILRPSRERSRHRNNESTQLMKSTEIAVARVTVKEHLWPMLLCGCILLIIGAVVIAIWRYNYVQGQRNQASISKTSSKTSSVSV